MEKEYRKMSDVAILEDHKQLRKLAKVLLNREEPLMGGLKSGPEIEKYLKNANDAHDNLVSLLDEAQALSSSSSSNQERESKKASIAKDIEHYMIYAANWAMQCVRNCCVRVDCIDKFKDHFDALATELADLDVNNEEDVESLVEKVTMYKYHMWQYATRTRSAEARAYSREYSLALMQEEITMDQLITREKNKLGFKEEFEDLEDIQKLEVYNSIINNSGRAQLIPAPFSSRKIAMGPGDYIGAAVHVVNASILVWDIFTFEHDIESAMRKTMALLSDIGGFVVGLVVQGKVTTFVASKVTGMLLTSLAGFVAATVAGFIFAVASAALLSLIFGSGASTPPPDLEHLKFQTAEMPDGMALAFEISHYR